MSGRNVERRTGRAGRWPAAAALAVALAAGSAPAAAQEAAVPERVSERYPADVVRGVEDLLERAGDLGLPGRVVADGALEGAAKRVPGDRLLRALERRLEGLRAASRALPADAGSSSLRAGADALAQGVSPADLRRVGEAAPEAERPAALVVLGELTRLGVPADRALESVVRAAERDRGGARVTALGQRVRRAVTAGESPLSALEAAGVGAFGSDVPGRGPGGGFPGEGPPGHAGPPVPPGAGPPGEPPGRGQGPPGDGPPADPPAGTPDS